MVWGGNQRSTAYILCLDVILVVKFLSEHLCFPSETIESSIF